MTTLRRRDEQPDATPDTLPDVAAPTTDELPEHRRGGQELPDDVQDRPEQNAGYDEAVHGSSAEPGETASDLAIDLAPDGGIADIEVVTPDETGDDIGESAESIQSIDDRAEQDVIAEVRHRERTNR